MADFEHPLSGLARGIQSGIQTGQQMQSLTMQREQMQQQMQQQEWENDFRMASAALDLGSKESLPAGMRANAINNGFLPVWNKYKATAKMEPVTEADFGDNDLRATWNQASKIIGDKKMDPSMQMEAITNLFGDFHVQRGQFKEAQSLAMNLVKSKQDEKANPYTDVLKERLDFQKDQAVKGIVEKFNADPSIRKAEEMVQAAGIVKDLVNSGNPISAGSVPTFMARLSGEVGNLSEADKAPFGGSRAVVERVRAAVQQQATGQLTEENAKFLLELSGTIEQAAMKKKESIARLRAKQYSKSSKFYKEQEVFEALAPYSSFEQTPLGGQTSPQPGADGSVGGAGNNATVIDNDPLGLR